jgi:hypothetical protein
MEAAAMEAAAAGPAAMGPAAPGTAFPGAAAMGAAAIGATAAGAAAWEVADELLEAGKTWGNKNLWIKKGSDYAGSQKSRENVPSKICHVAFWCCCSFNSVYMCEILSKNWKKL